MGVGGCPRGFVGLWVWGTCGFVGFVCVCVWVTCGFVGDSDGAVGGVDVLSSCALGTIRVDLQIRGIYHNINLKQENLGLSSYHISNNSNWPSVPISSIVRAVMRATEVLQKPKATNTCLIFTM